MLQRAVLVYRRTDAAADDATGSHCDPVARMEGTMNPEEMTALAEKYERWSAKVDGKETPECMAREYRAIAGGLRMMAGQSQSSAFHQVPHDEGKPDLAALWQAVIDNTKGSGFWLGEILLTTIEHETGFNGGPVSRPDRTSQEK